MSGAQAALDQAEAALVRWRTEHAAKSAELDRVRSMTDLDLDEDPAEASVRVAEQVLRLATELEVAAAAITAAEDRIDDARRGVLRERASDLSARAARIREVVAVRQSRTDELLDVLEAHEGARYESPEVAGRALFNLGADRGRAWQVPLTDRLARLAKSLDERAGDLDNQVATGTREQLPHYLARPIPERHELETRFVDPPEPSPAAGDDEVLPEPGAGVLTAAGAGQE